MKDNGDWIITGDTSEYKDCLITVCGRDESVAKKALSRMLNTPTDNDKKTMKDHTNLRIELVKPEDCWWRYGLD